MSSTGRNRNTIGARTASVRSSLENTRALGMTLTPRRHSQPQRAGTSRAPERGRSPVRSSLENTRPLGTTLTARRHSQPQRAGTSRAPKLPTIPIRSSLENTRALGMTLTARRHSQPQRAGTSRAPELRTIPIRSSQGPSPRQLIARVSATGRAANRDGSRSAISGQPGDARGAGSSSRRGFARRGHPVPSCSCRRERGSTRCK